MPLMCLDAKATINGVRMEFTQHQLNCTVQIQRAWRQVFSHRTTRKLLAAMSQARMSAADLEGMRLDDISTRLAADTNWKHHLHGAYRLIFLCQLGIKTPVNFVQTLLRCFRSAYFRAHLQINAFVGVSAEHEAIQRFSKELLETFEGIRGEIRRSASYDLGAIPAAEFNERLAAIYNVYVSSSKNKIMLPYYKHCLKVVDCLYQALQEEDSDESQAQAAIKHSVNLLAKQVKKIAPPSDYKRFLDVEVAAARRDMLPRIQRIYSRTGAWSLSDFLVHSRLADPGFTFAAEHEAAIGIFDTLNHNANMLIQLIQMELEQGVHALESIIVFSTLLEYCACRSARTMKMSVCGFTFWEQRTELCSGKSTWESVVAFMDAAARDLQRVCQECGEAWAKERAAVVSKMPSAVEAFVHGLKALWGMQRMANAHAINSSARPMSAVQSRRVLSSSLDAQVSSGATYLKRTREALGEVADTYPTFKKRILERSRGSRFAFHGLFVAHVVLRRTTDPCRCPETLTLDGPRLEQVKRGVDTLCDAAIIFQACEEEGEAEQVVAYIRQFAGGELLPVFMPMSPLSADRAEFALRNRRGEFERELTKFIALSAMQLIPKKLPDPLGFLQGRADAVVHELGVVIEADRATHSRLYGRLINDLCLKLA